MIRAVTMHAIERLIERRRISEKNIAKHIRRLQGCNIPEDGIFVHKSGFRYVMRGGTLVTVLYPDKKELEAMHRRDLEAKCINILIKNPILLDKLIGKGRNNDGAPAI